MSLPVVTSHGRFVSASFTGSQKAKSIVNHQELVRHELQISIERGTAWSAAPAVPAVGDLRIWLRQRGAKRMGLYTTVENADLEQNMTFTFWGMFDVLHVELESVWDAANSLLTDSAYDPRWRLTSRPNTEDVGQPIMSPVIKDMTQAAGEEGDVERIGGALRYHHIQVATEGEPGATLFNTGDQTTLLGTLSEVDEIFPLEADFNGILSGGLTNIASGTGSFASAQGHYSQDSRSKTAGDIEWSLPSTKSLRATIVFSFELQEAFSAGDVLARFQLSTDANEFLEFKLNGSDTTQIDFNLSANAGGHTDSGSIVTGLSWSVGDHYTIVVSGQVSSGTQRGVVAVYDKTNDTWYTGTFSETETISGGSVQMDEISVWPAGTDVYLNNVMYYDSNYTVASDITRPLERISKINAERFLRQRFPTLHPIPYPVYTREDWDWTFAERVLQLDVEAIYMAEEGAGRKVLEDYPAPRGAHFIFEGSYDALQITPRAMQPFMKCHVDVLSLRDGVEADTYTAPVITPGADSLLIEGTTDKILQESGDDIRI